MKKPKAKRCWVQRSDSGATVVLSSLRKYGYLNSFCLAEFAKYCPQVREVDAGEGIYIDILITKSKRQ